MAQALLPEAFPFLLQLYVESDSAGPRPQQASRLTERPSEKGAEAPLFDTANQRGQP
jgi:hypothetical protein